MEDSLFKFELINYEIKYSAVYSESNPQYFFIKNTKFVNLSNNNNGPVNDFNFYIIIQLIFRQFILKVWGQK